LERIAFSNCQSKDIIIELGKERKFSAKRNPDYGKSMKYYGYLVAGIAIFVLGMSVLGLIILKSLGSIYASVAASAFFSILVPVAFLLARNQVRNDRIHTAEVFSRTFEGALSSNSYFEFLPRKYYAGISLSGSGEAVPRYSAVPFASRASWLLFGSSLPFVIFVAVGVFIIVFPSHDLAKFLSAYMEKSDSKEDSLAISFQKDYESIIILVSLAFASSFLYALRLFFKSLAAYSSVAILFLRAFAHMLFSVMLAVMIWRVAPASEPFTNIATQVQNSIESGNKVTIRPNKEDAHDPQAGAAAARQGQVPKIWLILAFVIGFIPDAGFSWLLRRARLTLDRRSTKAANQAAVTPLTIIDGIDFATAFRLEEGNIVSVQNLAAANPVMLHVETAYCIFLIMDWIGQSQLCAAVGPERFLLFRAINIRTIFDLERAVLENDSPAGLKQIAGAILLAQGTARTSLLRDSGVRPLDVVHRDFDKALTAWVNVEVVEHLVRMIMDSLHIHRFRRLWRDIEASATSPDAIKLQPASPKIVDTPVPPSNGGGRDTLSVEIAASGKPAAPEMRTEIQGD
jgi:hypothetical protein